MTTTADESHEGSPTTASNCHKALPTRKNKIGSHSSTSPLTSSFSVDADSPSESKSAMSGSSNKEMSSSGKNAKAGSSYCSSSGGSKSKKGNGIGKKGPQNKSSNCKASSTAPSAVVESRESKPREVDAMSKSNEDHEQRVSAPNSPPVSAPAKAKTVISPEEPSGDDNVIDGKIGSEKRSNTPQEEVLQPAFVMNQDVETIDILEAANAPLASAHPARHHHHSSRHPSGRPSRQDEHECSRHYNQHSQSHSHRHSSSYRSHHSRARSPSPISHSPYSRSHHHRKHLSTSGIITSRRGRSRSPVSFTNNSRPGSRNGSTGGSASRNSSAGRPTSRNDSHSGSCVDGSSRPGSRCSAAATPTMANGNSNHPHHHRGHHHYRQERHPQVSSAAHAAATAAVAAVADHQSHRHHQSRYSPSHTMMNGEYSDSPPYDAENPHNGASADNNKWPSLGDSFDLPPLRSMSYGLLGEGSFDWNGANEQGDSAGATGGRSPSPPPDGRYYEHRRHPHYQDRRERDRNHDRERERERDRHYRSRSGSPHHHRSHSYSSRPSSSNSNYHHHHQHHNRDHYSPSRARSPSPSDHHRHSTRGRRDSYQPLYSEHHILSSSSRDYTRDGFSSPSSYKQGGNVNSNSKSSRSRRSRSSSARPPSSVFRGVAPSANTPSTAPVVRGRYGESWSFQDEDSPKSCNQHHQYDHSSDASHYSRDRRSRVDGFGGATSAFVEDSKLKGTIKHHSAHRSGNSKPSPEGSSRDLPEQLLLKLDSRSFQGEEGCEDNKKISFQAHSKEPSSPNAAAAEAANIDKELNATDGFENLMGITDGDYLANLSFRKSYDLEQVFSFMRPSFDQGDTGEVDGEENKIAPDGSNTHGSTRSHSRALSSFNLSAMSFSNSFGGVVPAGGDPVAEEPREAPPRDETSVRGDAGVILEQEQRNVAHDSKEDYGVDNNETIRKQHRRYTSSPSHHYRRGSPIGGIPTLHTLPSQGSSLGLTPINSFNCELVSGAGSGSGIIPLTSNDGMALREFFSSSPVGARTSPLPPVGMPPPAPATPRHDNLGYSHPKPSRSEAEVQRRRSPPPPSPRQPTHTPPSYTTNKYHRPHSRPPTYQHGPSVIDGGSTAGSLAVASTHESHPRSQAAVMPPNKRMKILRQHETKPLIDLSKRSDFFALLKKLAPALGGFQFKLPEIDFPQTASYNSYKPTEAQLTIARRRISSCICAFGGCVPSRTVSFDSIAPGTGSTLLNEKEEMEEKKKYEDQLSSRYFMKEQSISWDVELHEVITPKSASRKEATTELNKKEGHDSLYCIPITPNNNNPASSSDSNSRKEGQKTKYRCKLCGQPKQNHTCPYQSSLVRSIGTMVYPVVNAFETEEPGNLAPALSEMNNFTSLLSQDVSTSYGRERDPPYRPYTGGYSNVLTPDSHWSPNTPGGLSTMSDPSTPASTHGRPPQSSFRKREHLLLSRDETMSAASTSGGLLRGAMDLKREQYRNVRVFTDIIPGAYEYPHIPTPYAQRKEMGDTLFSLSREVPKLADSCAAILREARENDKWDQAVSELTTQVLIILKCEENDHTLEGLKRHLLTLGIAC